MLSHVNSMNGMSARAIRPSPSALMNSQSRHVSRLPVSSVKIDQSFVSDLESDAGDYEIVRAITSLAHTMGLSVTAEGVETPAQLEILNAMGCELAQGYFLGRPATAAALTSELFGAPVVRPRDGRSPANAHSKTSPSGVGRFCASR